MADKVMIPKQQIEIAQVKDEVQYGTVGKTLLPVFAKNLSLAEGDPLRGKSLKYVIFNPTLKTWVQDAFAKPDRVDAVRFLADIEERERPDSEYGPDRTIVQIYSQGQPVSKPGAKGGGGYQRRTLAEDLALESFKRVSIEGQTAVAQVGQVLLSGIKLDEYPAGMVGLDQSNWQRIIAKYWQAVEKGLDNYLAADGEKELARILKAFPHFDRPTDQRPANHDQANQDAKSGPPTSDNVSKHSEESSEVIKHVGDLLTRANKIGVNPAEVGEACGVEKPNELTDLEEAWKKVQAFAKKKREAVAAK